MHSEVNNMIYRDGLWLPKKVTFRHKPQCLLQYSVSHIRHTGQNMDMFFMSGNSGWDKAVAEEIVDLWNTRHNNHGILWPKVGSDVVYFGKTGTVKDVDKRGETGKEMALVSFGKNIQWVDIIFLEPEE